MQLAHLRNTDNYSDCPINSLLYIRKMRIVSMRGDKYFRAWLEDCAALFEAVGAQLGSDWPGLSLALLARLGLAEIGAPRPPQPNLARPAAGAFQT